MKANTSRRLAVATVAGLTMALVATACGVPDDVFDENLSAKEKDCKTYEKYGNYTDTEPSVSIYSPITDAEGDDYEAAWTPFVACTGIQIEYEGSNSFEAQIQVRVDGGDPPDIAFFPQPGLMDRFKEDMVPASEELTKTAKDGWKSDYLQYGTLDGDFYAQPLSANLKSLVWYSPKFFKDNGYESPKTWDEMLSLSDKIASSGTKPWCAGIESQDTTGWPVTDWIEDTVLRDHGAKVYDQWTEHKIAFDDPRIVQSMDKVGDILKNSDYVNGGYGDVRSMANQSFEEGGYPILNDECAMHRQASFYSANWPDGTDIGPDGDVNAFMLPGNEAGEKKLVGGGEYVAGFRDAPEVDAVREFLATDLFANMRMKTGAWSSSHMGANPENAKDETMKLSTELLSDREAEYRFDGSDLMPGHVGSKAFLEAVTEWIKGKSTKDSLAEVEKTWNE